MNEWEHIRDKGKWCVILAASGQHVGVQHVKAETRKLKFQGNHSQ